MYLLRLLSAPSLWVCSHPFWTPHPTDGSPVCLIWASTCPSWKECPALPAALPRPTTADHSCGMNSGTPEGAAPSPLVVSLNHNIWRQAENPARHIFHFTSCLPEDQHDYGVKSYHQVQLQGEREQPSEEKTFLGFLVAKQSGIFLNPSLEGSDWTFLSYALSLPLTL